MAIATWAFVLCCRGSGFRNSGLVYGDIEDRETLLIWKNKFHALPHVRSEAIRSFREEIPGHILNKLKLVNSLQPMRQLTFHHRRMSRRKI
jgi:hypothetical protein